MDRIGVYAAKTNLTKLLQRVEHGESIAITRNQRDVALLVPVTARSPRPEVAAAIARWRKARESLRLNGLKIKELRDEGRP